MIRAHLRRLVVEVTYLVYQTGLRGYCWPCDRLRWAWTHRRCARRAHQAGAEMARLIRPWLEERDRDR